MLTHYSDSSNVATHPCSYCSKTRKRCTLEWATKLQRQNYIQSVNGAASKAKRKRASVTELEGLTQEPQEIFSFELPNAPWVDVGFPVWQGSEAFVSDHNSFTGPFNNIPPMLILPNEDVGNLELGLETRVPETGFNAAPSTLSESSTQQYLSRSDVTGTGWFEAGEALEDLSYYNGDQPLQTPNTMDAIISDNNPTSLFSELQKSDSVQSERTQLIPSSLSPFSIDESITNRFNNHFISSGLLKIYHDVLENNLTCWLTESTCPYKSGSAAVSLAPPPKTEWGSTWSNRIYGRTLELDRAAVASGIVQISRSDARAASKALDLAIVAFAAQWAQGSDRQSELYNSGANSSGLGSGQMNKGFDRIVQRELWEQARNALRQVSDVESFKVAAAELIFGLTQKPLDSESELPSSSAADLFTCQNIGNKGLKSRILARLSALISLEGPPIYMERAARKLQALKARIDTSCHKCGSDMYVCGSKGQDRQLFLSDKGRATVDLLYWLAVMFDTLSSSMHDRPVVVSDQESRQQPLPDNRPVGDLQSNNDTALARWDIGNLIGDSLDEPNHTPTWPCSYEEAANAIIKSAPVKVLLFRHISYLQGMIRNGVGGKPIEDLIETTTSIYHYWELTYGSFFRSLVNRIESVPFRIQSWFSCIAAHWHLAALMLTDLIEFIDFNDLGTLFGKQCRTVMDIVATIRDKTTTDLADLATISTPREESSAQPTDQHREDFHHAVNGCVILTEPWTLILIKAFGAASACLLGSAERFINDRYEVLLRLNMAENCIKALWYLGKKSDLSRKCAEVLSVALNKLHVVLGVGR